MKPSPLRTLVFTDGKAGHDRQALALACALDLECTQTRTQWPPLQRRLSPWISWGVAPPGLPALHQYKIVVAVGRQSSLGLRVMKRHFPGIHTIQVLWPGKRFAEIDTLILPRHDLRESQADIRMLGALHDVDPDELQRLAHTWPEKWGKRETPVASVLVGAPHSATPYDWPMMKQWLDRIASTHAALLVTTSRRTPRHWAAAMRQRYGDQLRLLFDPSRSTADNPYTAMLAVADRIFVTPDSVSMISEAVASNVQVVVPDWPVKQAKFQRFLDVMVQHAGLVIGGFSGTVVSRQPVWDLPQVVQQIRQQCIID